jgi:hypothetical protein
VLAYKLPIVVGVSGHRDVPTSDHDKLAQAVSDVIRELLDNYKNTPIVVLSGLAEGSDRIAAEVALSLASRKDAVQLVAVLPMAATSYEHDFVKSIDEFRRLYKAAAAVIELPLISGCTANDIAQPGPSRDAQYVQQAEFIVRNSHIVIALWDGIDHPELQGGTSHVVRFALHGIPTQHARLGPPQSPLNIVDTGPVIHILTRRKISADGDGDAPYQPRTKRKLPEGRDWEYFNKIYEAIDVFNTRADQFHASWPQRVACSEQRLIEAQRLPVGVRPLLATYAVADAMAIAHRRANRLSIKEMFVLAGGIILIYELAAHFRNTPQWLLGLLITFFVLLLANGYTHYVHGRRNDHSLSLDYRAVAEALRIQIFWRLGGLLQNVADYYLLRQDGDLQFEWIRNAIRGKGVVKATNDGDTLIEDNWLRDQSAYFQRRKTENEQQNRRVQKVAHVLYWIGVGAAIFALIFTICNLALGRDISIVVMAFCPGVAALLIGYADKVALSEEARQYDRMQVLYQHAVERWYGDSRSDRSQLVLAAGTAALDQNADWLMLHRERDVGLVH